MQRIHQKRRLFQIGKFILSQSKASLMVTSLFLFIHAAVVAQGELSIKDNFDAKLMLDSDGQQYPTSIFLNSGLTGNYARFRLQNRDGNLNISTDSNTDGFIDRALNIHKSGTISINDLAGLGNRNVEVNSNGELIAGSSAVSSSGNYGTVVNPITGKVWLDRNLGASQVATSPTDAASYGDLYQWGRGADGHQLRTSITTSSQATNRLSGGEAWSGLFIAVFSEWLSTGEADMWSGTAAENNPCPSGFRIPTNAEWEQERLTWPPNNNDAMGAFDSPLKLPSGGLRSSGEFPGLLTNVGASGLYWSSSDTAGQARSLSFTSNIAGMFQNNRATGCSVRCIKD